MHGAPVSGINIYLFDENRSKVLAYTSTDENGEFTLSNLVAGTYKVYVTYPPFQINGDGLITLKSSVKFNNLDIELIDSLLELRLSYVTRLEDYYNKRESFTVYPNPTNGKILLTSNEDIGDVSIRVSDVTGRLIFNKKMEIIKSNEMYIGNLINQPAGLIIIDIYKDTQLIYQMSVIYRHE